MGMFRKKPVVIEALIYDGGPTSALQIMDWAHNGMHPASNSIVRYDGVNLTIRTLEGEHSAAAGDYIIKGVKGEFYPCKPDIFAMTYESEV